MNQVQLVCLLSIIAVAYAGGDSKEKDAKIPQFLEQCKKETKASDGDVEQFEDDEFPKTKIQHCFLACYYKKTGIMNEDNTINIDKALEDFTRLEKDNKELHGKLVKIMKECNTKYTPSKECDSIRTFMDCVVKSAKEAGIPMEK